MTPGRSAPHVVGRYVLYGEIASGGMATVHIGRLLGAVGFSKVVAIKRLHAQYAKDPEFVAMFLDEARVAVRVQHPNVVSTIDVVSTEGEIFVVMEYVLGETLARLVRAARARGERIPPRIAASVVAGALHGLHAAHEATNERGETLGLVHRDVSPQNIVVARDGTARVLDFGVAKAVGRMQTTRDGQLKGKLGYMAPEQLHGGAVTRRSDIFAAGIVLWEMLTNERLFSGENEAHVITNVLGMPIVAPSARVADLSPAFDAIALRALSRNSSERFDTAEQMALAIEQTGEVARTSEVATWLAEVAGPALAQRAARVAQTESLPSTEAPAALGPPEVASQRSMMSVMTSPPSEELRSSASPRGWRAIAWAGLLVAAVVVGFVVIARRTSSSTIGSASIEAAPETPSQAAEPSASATEVVQAAQVAPQLSALPDLAPPVPTMSTIVVSATASPSERPAERSRPAATVAKPPPPPPAKKSCDPPYRLDAAGRKIFKVECL